MSLADPTVFTTFHEDGSADFTIAVDGDDHQFSAVCDGSVAILSYEETCSWRGAIRTSEPREEVWKLLMQSDEMTNYLELRGLDAVRREDHV